MMDKQSFDEYVNELKEGKSNCIIAKGNDTFRFSLPGVKTLMTLLRDNPCLLKDSFVFDTVVGKGAAALMILGEVKEIYAELISDNAIAILNQSGIKFTYGERVPYIENKAKNGLCPIESVSLTSDDPTIIHEKIKAFISGIQSGKK